MPVMCGPDATRQMRQAGYTNLVIGVTGNLMEDSFQKFIEMGAGIPITIYKYFCSNSIIMSI